MRIIFLDFDGVITNIGGRTKNSFLRTENNLVMYSVNIDQIFNRLCVERLARMVFTSQAKIVFSTSWRNSFSPVELSRMLCAVAPFPKECFVGVTPFYDGKRRGVEINYWLKPVMIRQEKLKYVILDDAPACEFLPEQMQHFVQTDHMRGLQPEDVDRVMSVLKCSI